MGAWVVNLKFVELSNFLEVQYHVENILNLMLYAIAEPPWKSAGGSQQLTAN